MDEKHILPAEKSLPFELKIDLSGGEEPLHWHSGPEVLLCTGGHGGVFLNGKKYNFIRNDCVAVPPGTLHRIPAAGEPQYTALRFSGDYCRGLGMDPEKLSFSPFIINSVFSGMMVQLREFTVNPNVPYGRVKAQELALRVLVEMVERYQEPGPSVDRRALERVKSTVTYFQEHFAQKISLEQAAEAVGADKYALCRAFKCYTGLSPVAYLNQLRCTRAAELLQEGVSVGEAMTACGFTNRSYFAKTFHKYHGQTPSQYKKILQNH